MNSSLEHNETFQHNMAGLTAKRRERRKVEGLGIVQKFVPVKVIFNIVAMEKVGSTRQAALNWERLCCCL
jgi:hypothetical protein